MPLAERGYQIVAVELGPALADLARRNLARFPRVEVVTGRFEEWPVPAEPFDVVFSATAFHWLDPAVRVAKAAAALRPGGLLATVATEHVAGGSEAFFVEVQDCYQQWDPAALTGLRLLPATEIPMDDTELVASGQFGPARFHRYERDLTYTTAEYLELLQTYSGHLALPAPARRGLLDCIGRLIDRHGGRVTKRHLTELRYAYRLGEPDGCLRAHSKR
ncbi:MAG TPA: class I SAM-dependent methyltransferase [Natronosporangium sp.]